MVLLICTTHPSSCKSKNLLTLLFFLQPPVYNAKKNQEPPRASFKAEVLAADKQQRAAKFETLVLVGTPSHRRFLLFGGKEPSAAGNDGLAIIMDAIARSREDGVLQVDITKLGIKPETAFHFVRVLDDDNLMYGGDPRPSL